MSSWPFNRSYPSVEDLKIKAKKRIPRFAYEYLSGGCNEDVNLHRNTTELREVQLNPQYIGKIVVPDLSVNILGQEYAAPFGIAPIGLQGLLWPKAPEILARAAAEHNIPFVMSTVTTMDIEKAAEITEGKFWFQLYHPSTAALKDDLLLRASNAGCEVLVLLCDVPIFGFRPRDIRNGLSMPPRMTLKNIIDIAKNPRWAAETLKAGPPQFQTLAPYMTQKLNLKQLGKFMDQMFSGKVDEERIARIRDQWKGKIVLKGVSSEADTELAIKLGLDGIIVSNHGGRQLDVGPSSIASLKTISSKYGHQIQVMMDSGIQSGPDVARALASGAAFTLLGRTFMYSVAALGNAGGSHAAALLKTQLHQVMTQLSCKDIADLNQRLVVNK